jgi:hypothetical protein
MERKRTGGTGEGWHGVVFMARIGEERECDRADSRTDGEVDACEAHSCVA